MKRTSAASRAPDWLAVLFPAAGVSAVLGGFLPLTSAGEIVRWVLPLLVFLGSVIVLAELTAKAEVFDVLASQLTRLAAGNYLALFGLCVVFASTTTIFLNLDTTAVLLTPVMLATATKANIPGMPLAMLTAWLANTASLLLPVSNLTKYIGLRPGESDPVRIRGPDGGAPGCGNCRDSGLPLVLLLAAGSPRQPEVLGAKHSRAAG